MAFVTDTLIVPFSKVDYIEVDYDKTGVFQGFIVNVSFKYKEHFYIKDANQLDDYETWLGIEDEEVVKEVRCGS